MAFLFIWRKEGLRFLSLSLKKPPNISKMDLVITDTKAKCTIHSTTKGGSKVVYQSLREDEAMSSKNISLTWKLGFISWTMLSHETEDNSGFSDALRKLSMFIKININLKTSKLTIEPLMPHQLMPALLAFRQHAGTCVNNFVDVAYTVEPNNLTTSSLT